MNQLEEVKAYLYELSTRNTLDPEVIQNLRPEVLGEISLRVSHLKSLVAALEAVEVELRALDQVFGKDDDVIHAVITQIRQAITEALA